MSTKRFITSLMKFSSNEKKENSQQNSEQSFYNKFYRASEMKDQLMKFIYTQTAEPSKKELTEAVKEIAKKRKEENKSELKREPSLYNKFYKEKAAEIKEREKFLPKEQRMTAKAMMSYIANQYREENKSEFKR